MYVFCGNIFDQIIVELLCKRCQQKSIPKMEKMSANCDSILLFIRSPVLWITTDKKRKGWNDSKNFAPNIVFWSQKTLTTIPMRFGLRGGHSLFWSSDSFKYFLSFVPLLSYFPLTNNGSELCSTNPIIF